MSVSFDVHLQRERERREGGEDGERERNSEEKLIGQKPQYYDSNSSVCGI